MKHISLILYNQYLFRRHYIMSDTYDNDLRSRLADSSNFTEEEIEDMEDEDVLMALWIE